MFCKSSERNYDKDEPRYQSSKAGHIIHIPSSSEEEKDISAPLNIKPSQSQTYPSSKFRDSPKKLRHEKSKRHRTKRYHDYEENYQSDKNLRTTSHSELTSREKGRYYSDQKRYKRKYMEVHHMNKQTHTKHSSKMYRSRRHAEDCLQKDNGEKTLTDTCVKNTRVAYTKSVRSKKLREQHLSKCSSSSNEDYHNFERSSGSGEGNKYKETDTVGSVLQDEVELYVEETGNCSEDDYQNLVNNCSEDTAIKKKRPKDIDATNAHHYLTKKSKLKEKQVHSQTNIRVSDSSESDVEADVDCETFHSDTISDGRTKTNNDDESIHSTEHLNQKESPPKEVEDSLENSHFQYTEHCDHMDNYEVEEEFNKSTAYEDLPPYYPAIQGCRSVNEFQLLNHVEEGTYGVVYRARDKQNNEIVAMKRLKMEREKEGFPITSLREINTLLKGQHPNVVTVREIVVGNGMDKIYIVMDYVEHDLKSLMETMRQRKQTFNVGEVKCLLKQLLCAVAYLHDNWIIHRDLKTSNLLLSHKGILKVGDFGLAREYGSPLKPYTPVVVTLWYRAPELLLCTKKYSTPIDMWSVGCIFGEFILMKPVFPGKSEVDQLHRIFKMLGTPNQEVWPDFNELPAMQKIKLPEYPMSNLRSRFYVLSVIGLTLLQRFLTCDPSQRICAEKALEHPYFNETPLAIDPSIFPTWPTKDELRKQETSAECGQVTKINDVGTVMMYSLQGNTGMPITGNRPPVEGGFSLKF